MRMGFCQPCQENEEAEGPEARSMRLGEIPWELLANQTVWSLGQYVVLSVVACK